MKWLLLKLSLWMEPHTMLIAMGIVATLIFMYANDLNRWLRKKIKKHVFIVRLLIFILVCAFGYGALAVLATAGVDWLLRHVDRYLLAPVVFATFLVIGLLAERKHHV